MRRAIAVYFSPTNGTKKVVQSVAEGISENVINLDLTTSDTTMFTPKEDDIFIVGSPVYNGRVPSIAYDRLRKIRGYGQACVVISVYGNHNFGDALKELETLMKYNGLHVVAGGAFIAEHSFSNSKHQIAKNRPNISDLKEAEKFGNNVLNKVQSKDTLYNLEEKNIPGKIKLTPPFKIPRIIPSKKGKCIECGLCIKSCPVGAIDKDLNIDKSKCISCFACVKNCKSKSLKMNNIMISFISFIFSKERDKKNLIFI